ncbi:phosphopantetheine-binding protein [Kibdelosporangium phytohabitans]|uniref:Carrier domain-containing protein n=1 Tax=Kibdelosporangium phytohabitans TaxID=860235 RepID=A0A0N9HW44_9PSEU|nr:phosphopantetheine-binding protein [Kibdelosporangium phytohabitans]ALG06317.1 hypothetical protein AOZ06_04710 [Kibdelosporangium phytohabitans]MBE1467441.1 acyl carrier protein [Kibdelosporangium phytohabitans]
MDLHENVVQVLTRFGLPEDEIRRESSFDAMDADSLVLLEVALVLRKELGVTLDEDELVPELTATELVALIRQRMPTVDRTS